MSLILDFIHFKIGVFFYNNAKQHAENSYINVKNSLEIKLMIKSTKQNKVDNSVKDQAFFIWLMFLRNQQEISSKIFYETVPYMIASNGRN